MTRATLSSPSSPAPNVPPSGGPLAPPGRQTPIWKRGLFPALVLLGAQLVGVLCAVLLLPHREWILEQAIPVDYFEPELDRPDEFQNIAGPIYAFRHGINRSLIVDSQAGIAVFDPFNREHAERMSHELAGRFGGRRVRWVFYSHAHLDHVGGAEMLQPEEVIAHRGVMDRIRDFPAARDVLPVTRELDGDELFSLGGVSVQLVDLGHSHSESLYAFQFPEQRLVYAPDAAFVRTLPPFGLPDYYYPGYIRALDRLLALDFDRCVPAHFGLGTKADVADYRQMMVDYRQAAAALVADMGGNPSRGAGQRARIAGAYRALKAKYGSWHGFEAMFIPHFLGAVGATYVGY